MANFTMSKGSDSSYRKGAVMGLTVAESFILIAFALLMLLALWRTEAERDLSEAAAQLEKTREQMASMQALASLSQEDRDSIISIAESGKHALVRFISDAGLETASEDQVRELVRRLDL